MPANTDDVNTYIKEHKILELTQAAIKVAVKQRAADPAVVMAKHLMSVPGRPMVLFVLGGPGAGKGTQCAKIVEKYGFVHLSAGDLLRAERKSGSAQGAMIDDFIKEGKIVPVEVTIKLLLNAIEKDGSKLFLVDGFPRNTNNLAGWQQVVGEKLFLGGVLFYDVAEDILQARLLERGQTSGRTDDNIESIKKRFVTFKNESMPVVEYYKLFGMVHEFDGALAIDDVWKDTQKAIDACLQKYEDQKA